MDRRELNDTKPSEDTGTHRALKIYATLIHTPFTRLHEKSDE